MPQTATSDPERPQESTELPLIPGHPIWSEPDLQPGERALLALIYATRKDVGVREVDLDDDLAQARSKRNEEQARRAEAEGKAPDPRIQWNPEDYWPSNLHAVQTRIGGLYGMSVVAGTKGLGKTMFSLASALEAAATQRWEVFWFNAEVGNDELVERMELYARSNPGSLDGRDYFHLLAMNRGVDIDTMIDEISIAQVHPECRMLICMDSINSMSEMMDGQYLRVLTDLGLWAMVARRDSLGLASFLILSETNKQGGTKGDKLDYWADLIIKLTGNKKQRTFCSIDIEKSRRGGDGDLGRYIRDWRKQHFVRESAWAPEIIKPGEETPL